jgi:hypothetical protein
MEKSAEEGLMAENTVQTIHVYADTKGPGKCRGCGASITWAEIVKSGKRMCFNGSPVALYTHHTTDMRLVEAIDITENHWKSCPDADSFRRRNATPRTS